MPTRRVSVEIKVTKASELGVEVIDRCNLTVPPPHSLLPWPTSHDRVLLHILPALSGLHFPLFGQVLLEPGQEDLVDFLADHRVRVVASLPW